MKEEVFSSKVSLEGALSGGSQSHREYGLGSCKEQQFKQPLVGNFDFTTANQKRRESLGVSQQPLKMAEDHVQGYFNSKEEMTEDNPRHYDSHQEGTQLASDSVNAAYMALKSKPDSSRNP